METAQRILKNATVLILAHVVSRILAFLYVMQAARHLQASGFGVLSFALALAGIFGVVADLGLQSLVVRELARDESRTGKYLSNISWIKALLAVLVLLAMYLGVDLLGYPSRTRQVVLIIGAYVILGSFTEMIYSVFRARERMELVSLGVIQKDLLLFAGILFAVSRDFSITEMALVFPAAGGIVLVFAFAVLNLKVLGPGGRWGPWQIGLDFLFWRSSLRKALPFGLSTFFVMVCFWIDSVMLSYLEGDEIVGWYNAAYRIVIVFTLIPSAIAGALFPVLSRFFQTSRADMINLYEKAFKYLLMIGIPIGLGIFPLAEWIVPLVFGSSYEPAVPALKILIWAGVLIFPTTFFGTMLASIDRQDLGMYAVGICAVANVIMNILLIPRFSYLGAAFATLITELIGFVLQYWFLARHLHAVALLKNIKIPLSAGGVMFLILIWLQPCNPALLIFLGILVYGGMILLCKGVKPEELALFGEILKNRRQGSIEK